MRIFKFGGTSTQDSKAIRNIGKVLQKTGTDQTWLIFSAIGKTTNHLEELLEAYQNNKNYIENLTTIESSFLQIMADLFSKDDHIWLTVKTLFKEIDDFLKTNSSTDYHYLYDQVVPYGELISTRIISRYLHNAGISNTWVDVRSYIRTDTSHRDAQIDWETTSQQIASLNLNTLYLTQGFIAADNEGTTTTLGREGSDYTAAIFAYCTDAESVTIWKDVKGVLNADPRHFEETQLLSHISFAEAIELAYYGASVIHPKTIQPLKSKNIPLHVKSFVDPDQKGTAVSNGQTLIPQVPCYILKAHQALITVSSKSFSFIVEHDISKIFSALSRNRLKVNIIQNSAISLSLCIDDKLGDAQLFAKELQEHYQVHIQNDVKLYTIRHFTQDALKTLTQNHQVLMRQLKDDVAHIVVNT